MQSGNPICKPLKVGRENDIKHRAAPGMPERQTNFVYSRCQVSQPSSHPVAIRRGPAGRPDQLDIRRLHSRTSQPDQMAHNFVRGQLRRVVPGM
jgi:hypothetical protein